MRDLIDEGDRITYAKAILINGRSHRYLQKLATAGVPTRMGGARGQAFHTWLSPSECEALALSEYRRGHASDYYWMTLTDAAKLLGVSRQAVQQARAEGAGYQLNAPESATG